MRLTTHSWFGVGATLLAGALAASVLIHAPARGAELETHRSTLPKLGTTPHGTDLHRGGMSGTTLGGSRHGTTSTGDIKRKGTVTPRKGAGTTGTTPRHTWTSKRSKKTDTTTDGKDTPKIPVEKRDTIGKGTGGGSDYLGKDDHVTRSGRPPGYGDSLHPKTKKTHRAHTPRKDKKPDDTKTTDDGGHRNTDTKPDDKPKTSGDDGHRQATDGPPPVVVVPPPVVVIPNPTPTPTPTTPPTTDTPKQTTTDTPPPTLTPPVVTGNGIGAECHGGCAPPGGDPPKTQERPPIAMTPPPPEYHGYEHGLTCERCRKSCEAQQSHPDCTQGDVRDRKETVVATVRLKNGGSWVKVRYDEQICNTVTCKNWFSNESCCSFHQWQAHSYTHWTTPVTDPGTGNVTYRPDIAVPCSCGELLEIGHDMSLDGGTIDKKSDFEAMASGRCPGLSLADAKVMAKSCGFGGEFASDTSISSMAAFDFLHALVGLAGAAGGESGPGWSYPDPPKLPTPEPRPGDPGLGGPPGRR